MLYVHSVHRYSRATCICLNIGLSFYLRPALRMKTINALKRLRIRRHDKHMLLVCAIKNRNLMNCEHIALCTCAGGSRRSVFCELFISSARQRSIRIRVTHCLLERSLVRCSVIATCKCIDQFLQICMPVQRYIRFCWSA